MGAPSYYRGTTVCGFELTVLDVIEGFDLPAHEAMALKHLLRHGRKPGEPLISDLQKAVVYLQRKIDVLMAKAAGEATADDDDGEGLTVRCNVKGEISEEDYARAIRAYGKRRRLRAD